MHANIHRTSISLAAFAAAVATPAPAYDPVVLAKGWYRVASDQADGCRAEVGTNGQFYVLSVVGLEPDESGRLRITNGDMKPIDRAIRADGNGGWQRYYIPFRPNRGEGGMVFAQVIAADCALALEFPWQRRKGWEERAPLEKPSSR